FHHCAPVYPPRKRVSRRRQKKSSPISRGGLELKAAFYTPNSVPRTTRSKRASRLERAARGERHSSMRCPGVVEAGRLCSNRPSDVVRAGFILLRTGFSLPSPLLRRRWALTLARRGPAFCSEGRLFTLTRKAFAARAVYFLR